MNWLVPYTVKKICQARRFSCPPPGPPAEFLFNAAFPTPIRSGGEENCRGPRIS